MSKVSTPAFTQTPQTTVIQTTGTANTNLDGVTGSYSGAFTAGAEGCLVDYINFIATATNVLTLLSIFYAADGSTYRLIDQVLIVAVTVSSTVAAAQGTWTPKGGAPLAMKAGSKLIFSQSAGTIVWNCMPHLADY